MTIELKDKGKNQRNPQAAYEMNPDFMKGFTDAVASGRSRLALEYLVHIIRDHENELGELRAFAAGFTQEASAEVEVEPAEVPARKSQRKVNKNASQTDVDQLQD